jgi:hypothetical protein
MEFKHNATSSSEYNENKNKNTDVQFNETGLRASGK